jgi:hypothetical protein
MSAFGQKQTLRPQNLMASLPPIADIDCGRRGPELSEFFHL